MARAYAPKEIVRINHDKLQWRSDFKAAFHNPEATGIWFIGGYSQNGKTTFVMNLLKELAELDRGKVMINSLEEGTRLTMKENIIRHGLEAYNGRIIIGNEPYKDSVIRLSKQRSPWALIVDSVQLFKMTAAQFMELRNEYAGKKLIIFTSHMDKGEPKGTVAETVRYYADLKILVEGFRAISGGRFNAGGIYTIWDEGAAKYWGGKEQ